MCLFVFNNLTARSPLPTHEDKAHWLLDDVTRQLNRQSLVSKLNLTLNQRIFPRFFRISFDHVEFISCFFLKENSFHVRRESCVFARRIHDIIATCLNLFLTAGTGQGSVYRTSGALPQGAHRRSQGSCSGHLFRKVYGKFTLFNLFVVVLFFHTQEEKKKFEKQTAKFIQSQERHLNLSTKKQDAVLQEVNMWMSIVSFRKPVKAWVYWLFFICWENPTTSLLRLYWTDLWIFS